MVEVGKVVVMIVLLDGLGIPNRLRRASKKAAGTGGPHFGDPYDRIVRSICNSPNAGESPLFTTQRTLTVSESGISAIEIDCETFSTQCRPRVLRWNGRGFTER